MDLGIPVPSVIWYSLEGALKTNIRRLIKDITSTLQVPEDPLVTAILKGGMVRPYLVEEPATGAPDLDMRCSYLCPHPETPNIATPCGAPILWTAATAAAGRCPLHLVATSPFNRLPSVQKIESDELDEEDGALFMRSDGTLLRGTGAVCGHVAGKKIILFQVDEEEG